MTAYWEVNLSCPQALEYVVLARICVLSSLQSEPRYGHFTTAKTEPSHGHSTMAKISVNGGKIFEG